MPRALRTPKYWAIGFQPGVHNTMGCLNINDGTEVLAKDGTPVAGLCAAGEVTGGVHGTNRLGGISISAAVTCDRITDASAAKLANGPATR